MDDTSPAVMQSFSEALAAGHERGTGYTDALAASPALGWASPRAAEESAWHGHVSFAQWLVSVLKPRVVVELGTHNGVSYSAFCNAVLACGLPTQCYAIDTWQGDAHAGQYGENVYEAMVAFNSAHYGGFSTLIRSYFDEASPRFDDGSVDLLHIDGLHTYEAVKHDFESWKPKLSPKAAVLFHDTEIRDGDFGVWRLWAELAAAHPSMNFLHSAGLGVLAVGSETPPALRALCEGRSDGEVDAIRRVFIEASQVAREKGLNAVPPPTAQSQRVGQNVALNCVALQSSAFGGLPPTPGGAVNGVKDGGFGFHTDIEMDPWWLVDLGSVRPIRTIVVYNRLHPVCLGRARNLTVSTSCTLEDWNRLYVHDGSIFGGADGSPLTIEARGTHARFVRVALRDYQYLHLDEVEVFG